MTPLLGVDVSHFQGTVDWKRTGVAFGFAKATEGTGFRDPKFSTNMSGMRAAGIVPGAYHFLKPGSPTQQADWFCQVAPADVIHALDVEANNLDVPAWVARYRTHYPHKTLLIYTGRDLWKRSGAVNGAQYGPLWAAGYIANAYLAGGSLAAVAGHIGAHRGSCPFGGWDAPLFLQFTDKATVAGISGPCDGDVFYGTRAELESLAGAVLAPAQQKDDDVAEIKLNTASQVAAANINGGTNPATGKPWKIGETIPSDRVNTWGNLRQEQLYAQNVKVLAGQAQIIAGQAALTAALEAATAGTGDLTSDEVKAIAQAAATAALEQLGQALDPTPET